MLPLKSTRFEVNRDNSIEFNSVALSDLGPYICQAYSGQGRPVSMYVTVLGNGPARAESPEDEQYLQYVVNAQQPTPSYYIPTPLPPVELEPIGKRLHLFCLGFISTLTFKSYAMYYTIENMNMNLNMIYIYLTDFNKQST